MSIKNLVSVAGRTLPLNFASFGILIGREGCFSGCCVALAMAGGEDIGLHLVIGDGDG